MDLKKDILLGVGAVALFLAAREYGINSPADFKKKVGPYLKWIDVIDALIKAEQPKRKPRPALQHANHSQDGHASHASKKHAPRKQGGKNQA